MAENHQKFSYDNKDIIFTRSDKGNTTVALDSLKYERGMRSMLEDSNTYELVLNDPCYKITDCLRTLLSRWKSHGFIDNLIYRSLLVTDGILPRAYGLPKIHKTGYPLQIIVSTINSPLHQLAIFLHKIIKNSIKDSNSFIK